MFFSSSKLIWVVLKPGNLLMVIFLILASMLWMGKNSVNFFLYVLAFLLFIIALFPVGDFLLHPLEQRFLINPILPEQVDGIIVLSGAVGAKSTALTGQVQVNEQVDRELAFMKLARLYPNAKLLYTGGSSSLVHQEFKGADAGKKLLAEQGIDLDRVIFERESRNTAESAVLSKKLVQPSEGENWVLVTTAWHMPRSVGVFCKTGWSVIPYPVDYRTSRSGLWTIDFEFASHLVELEVAVKEWLGLLAYWATDRIPSLLPGRC